MNMLYITIHDIKHIESNKAVRQNETRKNTFYQSYRDPFSCCFGHSYKDLRQDVKVLLIKVLRRNVARSGIQC